MIYPVRPNKGMHPTADTHDFIYLQRCGAAGDTGRYAVAPIRILEYLTDEGVMSRCPINVKHC
jgi:hypothetical protein